MNLRARTAMHAKRCPSSSGAVADELLPWMRRDAHLHHLLYSSSSHSLLVSCSSSEVQTHASWRQLGDVIGGATFRLFEVGGSRLVLVVLALAVEQREDVCRRGYGTLCVSTLKALLSREAAQRDSRHATLLVQADHGEQASRFWRKQGVRTSSAAIEMLEVLHAAEPKLVGLYDGSTPCAWDAPARSLRAVAKQADVPQSDDVDLQLSRLSLAD